MNLQIKYLLTLVTSLLSRPFSPYRDRQRILIALTKGNAASQSRQINPKLPISWEFSGFSQNGEDGILNYLLSKLIHGNRYFLEIGSADGIDNNTAWLAIVHKYSGLMVEGDPFLHSRSTRMIRHYSLGLETKNIFVDILQAEKIARQLPYKSIDLLSIDIDGMDYYVANTLLSCGVRPKVIVVEYNSAYGPDRTITIPYDPLFSYTKAHPSGLYYGVSISAWKYLFDIYGYKFITVDSNGVNAFFVAPENYDPDFLSQIQPLHFNENKLQITKYKTTHDEQFSLIQHLPFYDPCL